MNHLLKLADEEIARLSQTLKIQRERHAEAVADLKTQDLRVKELLVQLEQIQTERETLEMVASTAAKAFATGKSAVDAIKKKCESAGDHSSAELPQATAIGRMKPGFLTDLRPDQYRGLSYEQASNCAIDVCRIAAQTGQAFLAADHLWELTRIMRHHLASSGRTEG